MCVCLWCLWRERGQGHELACEQWHSFGLRGSGWKTDGKEPLFYASFPLMAKQEIGDKTEEGRKTSGSHFKLDLETFPLTGHLAVRNEAFLMLLNHMLLADMAEVSGAKSCILEDYHFLSVSSSRSCFWECHENDFHISVEVRRESNGWVFLLLRLALKTLLGKIYNYEKILIPRPLLSNRDNLDFYFLSLVQFCYSNNF